MSRRTQQPAMSLVWETGTVTYVTPGSFTVSGDKRSVYWPGRIIQIPGAQALAAVVASTYSSDTLVMMSDAVCYPGMSSVAYVSAMIGQDLSLSASAYISGGDNGANVKGNAFDRNPSTYWMSSQPGAGVGGTAYIGCQFAAAKAIRWFALTQFVSTALVDGIPSVLLQYYNGVAWVTTNTASSLSYTARNMHIFDIPSATSTLWRILANASPSTYPWGVLELEMGE